MTAAGLIFMAMAFFLSLITGVGIGKWAENANKNDTTHTQMALIVAIALFLLGAGFIIAGKFW